MTPSQEGQDATGEAPTKAEQLEQKQAELVQAQKDLDAAELAMNAREVVRLQDEIVVLKRYVDRLGAFAAVEAAAEAKEEAVGLDRRLRETYDQKLAKLTPDIDAAVLTIKAMTDAIRKCARTWSQAAHARFELDLLRMRFGLVGGEPLDVLPMDPLAAVTSAFYEVVDKLDRLCRKESLPVVQTIASDTPEVLQAKEMSAAAEYVRSYATELKLSPDLVAAFAKAGPVPAVPARRTDDDGAFIPVPLPPGALQSAVASILPEQALGHGDNVLRPR